MIRTTALALCAAAPAFAGPFDGIYKPSPTSDCTIIGVDGGALKVEGNTFFGVESECTMTNAVNVRDMDAVLYDMQCRGEGEDWTSRALFMRAADDGLIMVWNGFAFKYDLCNPDAPAGTVTTSQDIGITQ